MKGSMKTPQVGVEHRPNAFRIVVTKTVKLSFLPDSDATVSSENSETEILGERERERDAAKKYAGCLNNSYVMKSEVI